MKTRQYGTSSIQGALHTGIKFLLSLLILAFIAKVPVAYADEPTPAVSASDQQTNEQDTASASGSEVIPTKSTQLRGSVRVIELNLAELRDVGLDLKNVMKAVSSLYDEVTIQPVTIITAPALVGSGVVINVPVGTMPAGPRQPARKKRVDLAMNAIRPVVTLLKTTVDEFISEEKKLDWPEAVLTQFRPQTQTWVAMVNELSAQLAQLNQLTQGPPYDNDAIASVTADMQKEVKQLDIIRRQIYKVIQKEGKQIAASHK